MRRPKTAAPVRCGCQHPGCKVKVANYSHDGKRYCAKHFRQIMASNT